MPKKSSPSRALDRLDSNFKTAAVRKQLTWIDAFDRRLALRGLGWLNENRKAKNFRRFPARAAGRFSEGLQILSHCPASVFVSFFTDATEIATRLKNHDLNMMRHMPLTGMSGSELFVREGNKWISIAVAIPTLESPTFEQELVSGLSRRMREYRLYLPLYKRLDHLALGFTRGSTVRPSSRPAGVRPIFFYGTSITQGGCANTAGTDFVSTLGRLLDTEVINFGFSGSGRGEPQVAELIREIDAEIFVLDYAANCEAALLRTTLPEFVRLLREKHPVTPIVLIGNICYDSYLWKKEISESLNDRRHAMMDFYLRSRGMGERNIHFIDGFGLIPPGIDGSYVDGVHPTSAGFAMMAERLAPYFRVLRGCLLT